MCIPIKQTSRIIGIEKARIILCDDIQALSTATTVAAATSSPFACNSFYAQFNSKKKKKEICSIQ